MSHTSISDTVINTPFDRYTRLRTTEQNKFVRAGIVHDSPEFDALIPLGGRVVHMPFWNALGGRRQVLSDQTPLMVNRINAGQDIARIHTDGNSWGKNLLAQLAAGDDPLAAIVANVGDFWAGEEQRMVLSSLQGVFAAPSMASNVHDISVSEVPAGGFVDAQTLNGQTFIDATRLLGDRGEELTAIAMHSATEAELRKRDLIQFVPASEGKALIKMFQGRTVVVDDGMPIEEAGEGGVPVFTSILFGPGAFARGQMHLDGVPLEAGIGTEAVEMGRDSLGSNTVLINRRRYILHPRGVKFTSASVAGESPTDVELATASNWERVYQARHIRMVCVKHNVMGAVDPLKFINN